MKWLTQQRRVEATSGASNRRKQQERTTEARGGFRPVCSAIYWPESNCTYALKQGQSPGENVPWGLKLCAAATREGAGGGRKARLPSPIAPELPVFTCFSLLHLSVGGRSGWTEARELAALTQPRPLCSAEGGATALPPASFLINFSKTVTTVASGAQLCSVPLDRPLCYLGLEPPTSPPFLRVPSLSLPFSPQHHHSVRQPHAQGPKTHIPER